MFRSLFFAIGIFLLILGVETLVVERWIMSFTNESSAVAAQSNPQPTPYRNAGFRANSIAAAPAVSAQKPVYQTKEWMPWSLLAGGTVIVLYSLSARNDGPAV